jgi:hypothetical protein
MGKNSVIAKPLGSTGDRVLGENSFVNKLANVATSTAAFGGVAGAISAAGGADKLLKPIGEGLGEITGANALRKQAMDQASRAEAEARRQADMSDAMARSAGGDPANIFLGTSRRKRGGAGGAGGSSGAQNSQGTGVQS